MYGVSVPTVPVIIPGIRTKIQSRLTFHFYLKSKSRTYKQSRHIQYSGRENEAYFSHLNYSMSHLSHGPSTTRVKNPHGINVGETDLVSDSLQGPTDLFLIMSPPWAVSMARVPYNTPFDLSLAEGRGKLTFTTSTSAIIGTKPWDSHRFLISTVDHEEFCTLTLGVPINQPSQRNPQWVMLLHLSNVQMTLQSNAQICTSTQDPLRQICTLQTATRTGTGTGLSIPGTLSQSPGKTGLLEP